MTTMSDASVSPSTQSDDPIFSPPPAGRADIRSVVVMALAKSGSVLLENVVREMATEIGITPYSPDADLWERGIPLQEAPTEIESVFHESGYCFGVFRLEPKSYTVPILETNRSVLQIRDPRDILVSLYYSLTKSHPRPPTESKLSSFFDKSREQALESTIDEYALDRSRWVKDRFDDVNSLLKYPLCRVFRYEDIIFEKIRWTNELARHFGWNELGSRYLKDLATKHDIRPKVEQPDAHIRSVTPGDHRRKLRPETIQTLNETFAPILEQFGYDD
jgi:hypothetical protein